MKYSLPIVFFAAIMITGCGDWNPKGYNVGVLNATPEEFTNATIRWLGNVEDMGMVVEHGGQASVDRYEGSVPPAYDVKWTTKDGTEHTTTVPAPKLPTGFNGTLFFKFCPDGSVKLVVVPLKGEWPRAECSQS